VGDLCDEFGALPVERGMEGFGFADFTLLDFIFMADLELIYSLISISTSSNSVSRTLSSSKRAMSTSSDSICISAIVEICYWK
jgi:hypothetical protein